MKKILALISLVVMFSACSKDEPFEYVFPDFREVADIHLKGGVVVTEDMEEAQRVTGTNDYRYGYMYCITIENLYSWGVSYGPNDHCFSIDVYINGKSVYYDAISIDGLTNGRVQSDNENIYIYIDRWGVMELEDLESISLIGSEISYDLYLAYQQPKMIIK